MYDLGCVINKKLVLSILIPNRDLYLIKGCIGSEGLPQPSFIAWVLITARKRSLGQGNILTRVCHSVHRGGVRGFREAYMVVGGHAWLLWGGVCMVAGGYAWLLGMCVVVGGMHGCRGCVCGCWGACMVAGGMCGCWGGMRDCGGGMCGCQGVCIGYDEIRSMSGWYASYWNAFLLFHEYIY